MGFCFGILLLAMFQSTIAGFTGFSYTDESIVLFLGMHFLVALVTRRYRFLKHEKSMLAAVFLFYLIGTLSTVWNNYQKDVLYGLFSGIFSAKAFIAYFGMRSVSAKKKITKKRLELYLWLFKTLLTVSAVLLILNQFFTIFELGGSRFGIKTTSFIFEHATEVGCYGIVSLLMCISLEDHLKRKDPFWISYIAAWIVVLAGGRYKAVAFIVLFISLRIGLPLIKKFRLRYTIFCVPAVWAVAGEQIRYYFCDKTTSRGALYYHAFKIAEEHFPLGSGFATYGTEFSRRRYSPLYRRYGMDTIYGLSESYPSYIADTMWPPILGETGWFGFASLLFFFVELFGMLSTVIKNKVDGLVLYGIVIYILFESIGDSIFMSSRGVTLFIALAVMIKLNGRRDILDGEKNT